MKNKKNINEITICTVCTNDELLIQKNIALISKLNKNINIKWIICFNKKINKDSLFKNHGAEIKYVEGVDKDHIGSIALNHSIGLNITKKFIDSRFVIFIDPDFFLLRDNSILELIKYLQKNKLSFLGAPWHPKWHTKYRYFPCSHFLIVDTNTIDLENFDFRPINIVWDKKFSFYNRYINNKKSIILKAINKVFRFNNFLFYNFLERKKNTFDGDTSHRIFLNLHKNIYKYEIFSVCFNINNDWLLPLNWKINYFIEKILPESLCFFPKNKNFIIFNSEFGNYLSKLSYEGFYWQNKVLGFHIRGHPKRMLKDRDKDEECKNVDLIFDRFNS